MTTSPAPRTVDAPLESRNPWIWPLLAVTSTINLVNLDLPMPIRLGLLVPIGLVAVTMTTRNRRWSVTFDGVVVEVRGGRALWRFRTDDVTAVIVPLGIPRAAIIRARPMERRMFGVRVPWPFPWAMAAPTYVRPEWFTEVAGISPNLLRPGPIGRLVRHR